MQVGSSPSHLRCLVRHSWLVDVSGQTDEETEFTYHDFCFRRTIVAGNLSGIAIAARTGQFGRGKRSTYTVASPHDDGPPQMSVMAIERPSREALPPKRGLAKLVLGKDTCFAKCTKIT